MELSVSERLVLITILPAEGSLTTVKLVHDLRLALSFTEEEHEVLKFEVTDSGTVWQPEGDVTKEIDFGPKAHLLLTEALEKLDEDGKLTEDYLSVCEKFLDGS